MMKRELIPLTSYDQVPEGMTEDEAHEFWSTHAVTEQYLATAPPVLDDAFPPVREPGKYVAVHLEREVFQQARKLARSRGIRVADLLEQLVTEAQEERLRASGS